MLICKTLLSTKPDYPDNLPFHLTCRNQPEPFAVAAVGRVVTEDKEKSGRHNPVTPFKLLYGRLPAFLIKHARLLFLCQNITDSIPYCPERTGQT